jgi:hypothetical protein
MLRSTRRFAVCLVILSFVLTLTSFAEQGSKSARTLIAQNPSSGKLVSVAIEPAPRQKGTVDIGTTDGSRILHMSIALRRSPEQQQALGTLLQQVRTPGNAFYGQTMSPEEFVETFGLSSKDLTVLQDWLRSQGFDSIHVNEGATAISFRGTVAQAQMAFKTELHDYRTVSGKEYFAPAGKVLLPSALAPAIGRVNGLQSEVVTPTLPAFDGPVALPSNPDAARDEAKAVINRGWVSLAPNSTLTSVRNAKPELVHADTFSPTTTTVTLNPTSVVLASGTAVTVTSVVSWTASTTPTGTLTLSDEDGGLSASIPLSSCTAGTSKYTCTYSWTSASGFFQAPNVVTATYGGDSTYSSSSGTANLTITYTSGENALSNETLTVTPNTVVEGQTTAQTITAKIVGSKKHVPTGNIEIFGTNGINLIHEFTAIASASGCTTTATSGTVTCTYSWNPPATLAAGSYTIYFAYSGDTYFAGYDVPEATAFTVTASGTTATTTTLTINPSTIYSGGTTFTTVTSWTGTGAAPTGSINITGSNIVSTLGSAVFPSGGSTTSSGSGTYYYAEETYTYSCTTSLTAKTVTCNITDSDAYDFVPNANGNNTITATYSGDTVYKGSSGTAILKTSENSDDFPTSLTVSPSPSSVQYGAGTSVAYTVIILDEFGADTQPTGTITLTGPPITGGTLIYTVNATNCPYSPEYGTATCNISSVVPVGTTPGSYTVTAAYSGDLTYEGSSATASVAVSGNVPTSTTASANPTSITYGANVTFTSVTTWTGSGTTPTGTVALTCGSASQGQCLDLPTPVNVSACTISTSAKTFTCSLTYNTTDITDYGSYDFVLTYSGDDIYAGSSASIVAGVGGGDASTTTLTGGSNPSTTYGAAPTESYTASVQGSKGDGAPTGSVLVSANGTLGQLGSATVSTTCTSSGTGGNKVYTCPATGTYSVPATAAAGNYTLTFQYSGDPNYTGSTATTTLTIGKATPTAAASNVSGLFESTVTLSATNTGVTGASAPTGTVTFTVNGVTVTGTPSCSSSGAIETCTESYTLPATLLGGSTYPITATFAADTNYNAPATAGRATLTVTAASPNLTFTSVSHNFGQVAVGTAAAKYGIQITNSNTVAYPFSLVFTPANGFTSANNCGTSIAPGGKCELVFYFTPTATGPVSATWSLTPETATPAFVYGPSNGGTLQGSGTPQGNVSLTTNGHDFGTVAVGTQSPTYGTELSNSTTSTETISLGTVSAPFTMLTNCGTTLAPGSSCEIEFYFTPTSTSPVSVVVPLSGSPTAITSGGSALPNGGITLSGN